MQYRCLLCGYIYDDDKEEVPFAKLPDDWTCPVCGSPKSMFELVPGSEKGEQRKETDVSSNFINDDEVEFTPNELAILMGNLARGSEKQYKAEEQQLFLKLKEYFESKKSSVNEAKLETIIAEMNKDLSSRYLNAMNQAKAEGDRGAQRALTWSTKVTTIVNQLLETYKKEGDKMLEGKKVFVCTICGFIFIGEKAPDICPICKVPSFKFEEVI